MKEQIDKLLLDPSFRNWALNLNAKDYEQWENILHNNSSLGKMAAEAKAIVIQIELTDVNYNVEDHQSFDRMQLKLKNTLSPASFDAHIPRIKSRVSGLIYFINVAAVLSFMIAFSGLFYFVIYKKADEPLQAVVEILNKKTQNGQHLTVRLPDGSIVKLNSNSSISYPKNFFKNRWIELEGEAFFTVMRDESNPFTVKTKNFQTEVLGTSFNVNAYSWSDNKVSVAEGKVKVSSSSSAPDQAYKILTTEEAVKIINSEFMDADYNLDEILWKDGYLVFNNENINTISAKVQRWFDVTVIVKNKSMIESNFSGKYANESLEKILIGMGYAMNFTFEMNDNQILITGKNN